MASRPAERWKTIKFDKKYITKIKYEISNYGRVRSVLPDGSYRYLITREDIQVLSTKYKLALIEPVKTTNVDELRAMTTVVWQKK